MSESIYSWMFILFLDAANYQIESSFLSEKVKKECTSLLHSKSTTLAKWNSRIQIYICATISILFPFKLFSSISSTWHKARADFYKISFPLSLCPFHNTSNTKEDLYWLPFNWNLLRTLTIWPHYAVVFVFFWFNCGFDLIIIVVLAISIFIKKLFF